MKKLQAYHNDPELKKALVREIKKHEEADAIVQGHYGKENGTWKGCALACSLRSLAIVKGEKLVTQYDQHERYETDLGVPRILARLEDRIFEGLSVEDSKTFPRKFAEAIPVGADLSLVWPKFAVWLLGDEKDGVLQYAKTERQKKAIEKVVLLYQKVIDGETVSGQQWKDAYAAAYAAGAGAADAAAYAVVYAVADAVADAAYAAGADARKIHYKKCAEKLIEILKETK